jgi:hypothetical protein
LGAHSAHLGSLGPVQFGELCREAVTQRQQATNGDAILVHPCLVELGNKLLQQSLGFLAIAGDSRGRRL